MRMTWKKEPLMSGLARIGQFANRERGFVLSAGGQEIGAVSHAPDRGGWYWYARVGDHFFNSAGRGRYYPTSFDARAACKAWAKEHTPAEHAKEPT
jgi:hypothetical protein